MIWSSSVALWVTWGGVKSSDLLLLWWSALVALCVSSACSRSLDLFYSLSDLSSDHITLLMCSFGMLNIISPPQPPSGLPSLCHSVSPRRDGGEVRGVTLHHTLTVFMFLWDTTWGKTTGTVKVTSLTEMLHVKSAFSHLISSFSHVTVYSHEIKIMSRVKWPQQQKQYSSSGGLQVLGSFSGDQHPELILKDVI